MLVVTTPTVEGMPVKQYIGMVSGETIAGVNMFKDFAAGLSNMFGGRASSCCQAAPANHGGYNFAGKADMTKAVL